MCVFPPDDGSNAPVQSQCSRLSSSSSDGKHVSLMREMKCVWAGVYHDETHTCRLLWISSGKWCLSFYPINNLIKYIIIIFIIIITDHERWLTSFSQWIISSWVKYYSHWSWMWDYTLSLIGVNLTHILYRNKKIIRKMYVRLLMHSSLIHDLWIFSR